MKLNRTALFLGSALLLVSCESLSLPVPGLPGAGGGGNAMVDAMKNQPAMNMMVLPPNPAVGQAWTMDMSGMEQRTAIVAEQDGMFIVEQGMDMGGEMIIQAFLVDPSVDLMQTPSAGDEIANNVKGAWIGAEGNKPVERPLMEPMIMPEVEGVDAATVDVEQGTQTVELGGRSWDTEWSEAMGSRSWMLAGSNFLVRSDMEGNTVMVLSKWETDAEPALDWTE